MALSWRARKLRAASGAVAAVCLITLAACGPDGQPNLEVAQPRGATVAFESIDGPPPAQFRKLVDDLNTEAQTRRLAVTSRETASAYRIRGYLAAETDKNTTKISWVWDVFDGEKHRALRVTGAETIKGHHRDAWSVVDDAMLRRIAHSSMDQFATFLTSPEVAPSAPEQTPDQVADIGGRDTSPEAAGIFRIFAPHADPVPTAVATPAETTSARVPLPRARPPLSAAVSARGTVTLAASARIDGR